MECGVTFSSQYKLSKHRKSAGHIVMCKRYPKRNCTNVNNYVQAVKKIRLELDKKHIEDNKEEQGEK